MENIDWPLSIITVCFVVAVATTSLFTIGRCAMAAADEKPPEKYWTTACTIILFWPLVVFFLGIVGLRGFYREAFPRKYKTMPDAPPVKTGVHR
jgi:hypothetical protein